MKSLEAGVITTFTLAPALINILTNEAVLYAAIPAVMPNSIFLPLKIDMTILLENLRQYFYSIFSLLTILEQLKREA